MPRRAVLLTLAIGSELIAVWGMAAVGNLRTHLIAFLGLFVAATCALIWAWRLMRTAAPRLTAVVVIALVLRLPFLSTEPSLSDDVWRYLHDGRAQLAGYNPYDLPPADPRTAVYRGPEFSLINHPDLPTIYPPVAQLAFLLNALLGSSLLTWRLLLICSELIVIAAVARLLRRSGRPPANLVLYAWHPLAVIEVAGGAHLEPIGIALLFAGMLAAAASRPVMAGLSFGLSAAFKFVAAPVAVVLTELRGRTFWVAALMAVALAYACYWPADMLGSLPTFAANWEANPSVYALINLAVDGHRARILAATLLVCVVTVLRRSRLAAFDRSTALLLALFLVSPVAHPWYLLWLVAFLPLVVTQWLLYASLAWSLTVPLAYAELALPEYVPVFAILGAAAITGMRRRFRPRTAGPSEERTLQISA